MKNFLMSAMSLAVFAVPSLAAADDVTDRTEAIRLCRAEVAAQTGADVRLDQVRVRGTSIRVELDVWRDGNLQNVRCDVARNRGNLTIASITPPIQTASTQPATATAE